MVSLLSFNSYIVKQLLKEEYSYCYNDPMFPIFYLNKESNSKQKQSALDLAMKNNQIKAVEMII